MKIRWSKKATAVVICVAVFAISAFAQHSCSTKLSSQNAATRWSQERTFSQVSCFFSPSAGFTRNSAMAVHYKIQQALTTASLEGFVDCYSAETTLELRSDRAKSQVRCMAVGGDFFVMHPLQLLAGCYFNSEDLNQDGVILDEQVAWDLFGSSNIIGMTVQIGDYVYPIRGVVKADGGMFAKASKTNQATAYIAFPLLDKDSANPLPVTTYEAMMPSPVEHFAFTTVETAMEEYKDSCEQIENTTRFSIPNRFRILKAFGTRSMRNNGIVYPYWENQARGYEDVIALCFLISVISLIYPGIVLIVAIHAGITRLKTRRYQKKHASSASWDCIDERKD